MYMYMHVATCTCSWGRPWGSYLRSCRQVTGGSVCGHGLFMVVGLFLDCGGKKDFV